MITQKGHSTLTLCLFGITAAIAGAYPIGFLSTLIGILPYSGFKYMGPNYGLQAAWGTIHTVTFYGLYGGFLILAFMGIGAGMRAKELSVKFKVNPVLLSILLALIGDILLITGFFAIIQRSHL
jgi:hypothetical protein